MCLEIYNEHRKSKVLLFGEADRKLYKNKIMNKKKDCKFRKGYKYINLAKIDDVYLIDRYKIAIFDILEKGDE